MLTRADLAARRLAIAGDPDLTRLLETLRSRAGPLIAASPPIPEVKALLSRDGGIRPNDGASLRFDPWSPSLHHCPGCGKAQSGDRHHRHWARAQHLWLVERMAELALLAALTDDPRSGARAVELLTSYETLYFELPNRDNVLGPSHLFFSTYLESLWLTSYLAAACILRQTELLPDERIEGVNRVADEAANLIGEFNEGLSNRQTWHATALTAIATWFDDEELARTSIESATGLLGHLTEGFGDDGLWWEGENYHLFALRGLMQGIHWARAMGFDLVEEPELRRHFRAALLGPTLSALPDFTYPARRDSRYGVSLAQPASLELWEIGRAWLSGDEQLDSWLGALYAIPSPPAPAESYDAWLHDAGRPVPARHSRGDLSWWALTAMGPAPAATPDWRPESVLLASQGLAVLRQGNHYASLECGAAIGGHGHPDRLHLTLHADGVHWLPDQGTGSYVHPTLAWYRSALAHNAPLIEGANAGGADAWCEAFDTSCEWAWCRGRAGEASRTLIAGPTHLVDIVEVTAGEAREVVLPWHFQGKIEIDSEGRWERAELEHAFVTSVEREVVTDERHRTVTAQLDEGTRRLQAFLPAGAEILRAIAPGLPSHPEPRPFLLLRDRDSTIRWVTLLDLAPADSLQSVDRVEIDADRVIVTSRAGTVRYEATPSGLEVHAGNQKIALAGLRVAPSRHVPFFTERPPSASAILAPRIELPPALDGTLEGFDLSEPLELNDELQYRRSEEPYDGERLSAQAWLNWDGEALYLAVAVSKPELVFRPENAPPLLLDNEPDDIHSDGLQIYWRVESSARGFLVIPRSDGGVLARSIASDPAETRLDGRWSRTSDGYLVTLRLDDTTLRRLGSGAPLGFDLLINEMQPGRLRRSGQLIWSGGGGWVYLRGDRHEIPQEAALELG